MKNLFIDSQIWLALYDFSSDDLEQFRKLSDLLDDDLEIFLTKQVLDEFKRNRENKIKHALEEFKKINVQIPNLCKGYDEYNSFKELQDHYISSHKYLLKKIQEDIECENLHADKVINEIFEKSDIVEYDNELLERAILRFNVGNPPGKDKSYGDAINWEILLQEVPEGEDLFFVGSDRDYRSVLNNNSMNRYLRNEWVTIKKSEIFFYTSLTQFFNTHIKDIELKSENYKNELIDELRNSGSFSRTHIIINKLSEYSSWDIDQIRVLLEIADDNSQIYGIIKDEDLNSFFTTLIKDKINILSEYENLHWIIEKIGFEIEKNNHGSDDIDF